MNRVHIFVAAMIGACVPDLLPGRRRAWRGRPVGWSNRLLRVCFSAMAGYLAVVVFECQSPLQGLVLGLILDELLLALRSVGVIHMSTLASRILGASRTVSLPGADQNDYPIPRAIRSNKKSLKE